MGATLIVNAEIDGDGVGALLVLADILKIK